MATEIYLQEGWVQEMIETAKEAHNEYSPKDEAILREIDKQCRANDDSGEKKPITIEGMTNEELAKHFGRMLEADVKNWGTIAKDSMNQERLQMRDGFNKFRDGMVADYEKFKEETANSYQADREKKLKDYEATKPRIPDNVHGKRGPAGVSDFINAGFTDEKRNETHAAMSAQREEHDVAYKVAVAQLEATHEMGLPADQIYAPGHEPVQQAQEHVTGVNQTAPRLVEGTDVSYWVDDKGNMQIDAGDSRTLAQAQGVVNKDLTTRQKNGEELHPAEVQFMADYKQMAMSRGMRSNSGMSIA